MDIPFLHFLDQDPRAVNIALLGLVVAGGVAGSLYVLSLQSALTEHKQNVDGRFKLVEQRYESDTRSLKATNARLRLQSEKVSKAVEGAQKGFAEMSHLLTQNGKAEKARLRALEEAAKTVQTHLRSIADAVSISHETLEFIDSLKISSVAPATDELSFLDLSKYGPIALSMSATSDISSAYATSYPGEHLTFSSATGRDLQPVAKRSQKVPEPALLAVGATLLAGGLVAFAVRRRFPK